MDYIGTTIRIHSFIPTLRAKVRRGFGLRVHCKGLRLRADCSSGGWSWGGRGGGVPGFSVQGF